MSEKQQKPAPIGTEDLWAIGLGGGLLAVMLVATAFAGLDPVANPLARGVAKPGTWINSPVEGLSLGIWAGIFTTAAVFQGLFRTAARSLTPGLLGFFPAFLTVFALATLAFVLGGQAFVKSLSLSYPLFAILAGLAISNTVGVPRYLRPALRGELYIKTGLVLYGGELLLAELFALGPPGMAVAWLVTPVVLVATYLFGQKVLGIESKTLNVVVSADMSVCGVSAAIATAAACKAKKEELSLAVGISMLFTAVMMFAIPAVAVGTGMDARWAGAWIGGTIDSSGAVAAAGETLGEEAAAVAITVKLIQNVLIGVIAFAVATYWVTVVESAEGRDRPGLGVVWERFPKFVLGFLGASVVFSLVAAYAPAGEEIVTAATKTTKTLRAWCFCLAFVAIGLETDFRQLRGLLAKGKPLVLYACGQTLNIVLTLAVAYVMFVILFPAS